METLLTPSESLAFQSFLTTVDGSQPSNDWAIYSAQFNPNTIPRDDNRLILDPLPSAPENESLAKATKDLMSLDTAGWSNSPMMSAHLHQQQLLYDHQLRHQQQQRQHSYSSAHDTFPFLNPSKTSFHPNNTPQHSHQQYNHPYQSQQYSLSLSIPTSPPSPFSFPHHAHQQQQHQLNNGSSSLDRSHPRAAPPNSQPENLSAGPKRSTRPTLSPSSASSSSSTTTTRQRAPPQSQRQESQSPHMNGTSQGSAKPALLSPSQKKANHIQSEQKRRANIRRGYEALCETVPALSEAIREEEEEARQAAVNGGNGAGTGGAKGKPCGKKRATKKKDGDDGGAKDRTDGRAGPRSENVVLSKTIDYINDLLSEKEILLSRLQRARSMLPPGHPSMSPLSPNPAWERVWKGGDGKFAEEEEEGEESDGDGDVEIEEEMNGLQPSVTRSRPRQNGGRSS